MQAARDAVGNTLYKGCAPCMRNKTRLFLQERTIAIMYRGTRLQANMHCFSDKYGCAAWAKAGMAEGLAGVREQRTLICFPPGQQSAVRGWQAAAPRPRPEAWRPPLRPARSGRRGTAGAPRAR